MKLKNILKLILLISIILCVLSKNNIVNAAGYSITATSYDVEVGASVTINVSFTAATWDIVVSGKGITEGVYAGYTEDLSEKTTSKSISLNTSTEGTYTITMVGSITDENGTTTKINKSISVKVSKPSTSTKPSTNTSGSGTTTTTTTQKSSEARLSNLGIKPNDFKGFKRDKTEYSVTVPNNVSEVEIYGDKVDSKATVEGLGKVSLKEGNNSFSVKVTAEDGKTTKTYTLTIKRQTAVEEESENGEARLKSLGIKPKEYDFTGFDSEKTEYSVEVPNDVEEIELYATAMNSSAQITGTGMIELEEGINELLIDVIAVNGTKKTYTLKVIRKNSDEVEGTTTQFGLATLLIDGVTLNPSFNAETYEYTVELEEDLSSLEITTKANDENATVEIFGNENLQQGENVITIQVTNEETKEVAIYQVIVNKNLKKETVQTSWLKPSTWGKEEIFKIIIIVVLIILIVCAVILKINIGKESSKNKKVDFPGAEELDKAIAEHQELSEEPNYTHDDDKQNMDLKENESNYIEEIAKNRLDIEDNAFEEKTKRKGRHF